MAARSFELNYNIERSDLVSQVCISLGNTIPDAPPFNTWLIPAGDVLSIISTADLVFDKNLQTVDPKTFLKVQGWLGGLKIPGQAPTQLGGGEQVS